MAQVRDLYTTAARSLLGDGAPPEGSSVILETLIDYSIKTSDQMSYLLRFEEYLDDSGIYAYGEEWFECEIVNEPKVSSYWFVLDIMAPEGTDLRGARRVTRGTKNTVLFKKMKHGTLLRFKILRRELDNIESRNERRAEKDAEEDF